jgi:hypothetical protein
MRMYSRDAIALLAQFPRSRTDLSHGKNNPQIEYQSGRLGNRFCVGLGNRPAGSNIFFHSDAKIEGFRQVKNGFIKLYAHNHSMTVDFMASPNMVREKRRWINPHLTSILGLLHKCM